MISHLRGSVHRGDTGEASIDAGGVGYRVTVPIDVWETLEEGAVSMLWISAYVREDRFDLYGFRDRAGRMLFEEFLKIPGIGPRLGLELCAVPKSLLQHAVSADDPRALQSVKGIGKKTAEKLIVELRSLSEKHPHLFASADGSPARPEFDRDAVEALKNLGYDTARAMQALRSISPEITTTEDRVTVALRSL